MRILASAAVVLMLSNGAACAAGDAAAGATTFKQCMTCHSAGEGAKNKVGPVLNDVVGRQPGTYDDYKFSQAMKDFGAAHPAWTPELLAQYLPDPKAMVPGTKMTFAGLKKQEDVDNVIAYLISMSPSFVPGGAPAAPAATPGVTTTTPN